MDHPHYDVVIVGAGVAGSALAHALATIPSSRPLEIALVERSFSEPDRIVGELLQPGGLEALHSLGMADAVQGIDAITVGGYVLVDQDGESVTIPYPEGKEGRSFHHGRFVMGLRRIARAHANVHAIEATAVDLIEEGEGSSARVRGIRAACKPAVIPTHSNDFTTKKDSDAATPVPTPGETPVEPFNVYGSLVIVADGCFSNFRNIVMGKAGCRPTTKSYFVGTVLHDVDLPVAKHGTVILPQGNGPVLLYQVAERDTRMLIDIQHPMPADLRTHILTEIVPKMPLSLQPAITTAFSGTARIRRMPNSFLPSVQQGSSLSKSGVLLLGDSWNMRHPLTGGGMTVALNDVVYLRAVFEALVLADKNLGDWEEVRGRLRDWHWGRKPLSSTINILSGTLYGLFEKDDDDYRALRKGCFKYFQRGGKCIDDPVSLLSGLSPSPLLLSAHFFAVIFYAIWVIFTHPRLQIHPTVHGGMDQKAVMYRPGVEEYPALTLKGARMFSEAIKVFLPVLWSEIRWWAPDSEL